jgi:hypothetical protein
MLAGLLYFRLEHQIALVYTSDCFDHFWQFTGDQRFNGDSDGGLGPKFKGNHNIDFPTLRQLGMSDGGCLCNSLVDAFHKYQVSSRHRWHLNSIPSLKYIQFGRIPYKQIFLISWHVVLSHDPQPVILLDRTRYDPSKDVESLIVFCMVHFDSVDQ